MAESKGFFRRIFSFASSSEAERVPERGETPRSSDTLVGTTGAPDPDLHQPAAASTEADAEAGASPTDGDGIEPLSPASAGAPDQTTEKKTPN